MQARDGNFGASVSAKDSAVAETAIRTCRLGKTYRLYADPYDRIVEHFWRRSGPRHHPIPALIDVSFDVPRGACLGLVGSNGSGKSTLLRLLAGMTYPTAGTIEIHGRVGSLLELGQGFHPHFTGRENISLCGAALGMSRDAIARHIDAIITFSELGEFIDRPLRTYSSGMVCRLAFSVATATDPDVLLIDEVIGVGDLHFQEKCARRMQEIRARGTTILLATHSLYQIRQLCDRALWLHAGRIRLIDDAITVSNEYNTYETSIGNRDIPKASDQHPASDPALPSIVSAELIDARNGHSRNVFAPGDTVAVRVVVDSGSPPRRLSVAIGFFRQESLLLFGHSTQHDGLVLDLARGVITLRVPDLKLLAGEYLVMVWLFDGLGAHLYVQRATTMNLIVRTDAADLGVFRHDHEWSIEPGD